MLSIIAHLEAEMKEEQRYATNADKVALRLHRQLDKALSRVEELRVLTSNWTSEANVHERRVIAMGVAIDTLKKAYQLPDP